MNTTSGPCQAGYYCTLGAKVKAPVDEITGNKCPTGKYCPSGTSVPYLCLPGTYSNATGNKQVGDCTQCEQGKFCGNWGLTSPSGPCWAGYYCPGGQNSSHPEEFRYGSRTKSPRTKPPRTKSPGQNPPGQNPP